MQTMAKTGGNRAGALLAILILLVSAESVFGQAKKKKDEVAPPQNVSLLTKDGVVLACTYYEGKKSKETVPIVMLPGYKGRRSEFGPLAKALQKFGHSVITVDLRGHGGSTRARTFGGDDVTLDASKMGKRDFANMIGFDMEEVKRFLMKKHRAGELNIELLTIIGSDLGSLVALNWSAADWSAQRLPTIKQGQDVQALVLISPKYSFKGLSIKNAMAHPAIKSRLSIMIVAGQSGKVYSDSKRIFKAFEKRHPLPPEDERVSKQSLYFITPDVTLQGTKLLDTRLNVPQSIATFIQRRLVNRKEDFPWMERKSVFSD